MKEAEEVKSEKSGLHIPSLKEFGKDKFIIMILVGILLFIIAIPVDTKEEHSLGKSTLFQSGTEENEMTNADVQENISEMYDTGNATQDAYVANLEERLAETLCYMQGVGRVKVMVTLKASAEKIVEKDVPSSRSNTTEIDAQGGNRSVNDMTSEESTVYIMDENGTQTPYVVKNMEPTVEGVVVVAEGGNNAEISKSITEAIQALFNLEAHKIKVIQMKKQ